MFYQWDLGEERIVPASHLRGHSHSWWGRQECSLAVGVSLSHHLCTQEAKRKMGSWQGGGADVTVKIHTLHWLISSVRALLSKGSTASTKQHHLLESQHSHTQVCGDISHPRGPCQVLQQVLVSGLQTLLTEKSSSLVCFVYLLLFCVGSGTPSDIFHIQ